MSKVLIEESTQVLLEALQKKMPQSILLHGETGVGLSAVAGELAKSFGNNVVTILPEKNEVVDIEKGNITIASIRKLYDLTRTKGSKKLIIIDYAERMAAPAQNAFLKLLEEPNDQTFFVLLSHDPAKLLPTVLSRVQSLEVRPITKVASEELLDELGVKDEARRQQLLFMASGLPAELMRLQDENYFEKQAQIVKDAHLFVTGRSYQRSLLAHKYRDDRPRALLLIDIALKLLKLDVIGKKDPSYLRSIDKLLSAREAIVTNGNIRLQLSVAL